MWLVVQVAALRAPDGVMLGLYESEEHAQEQGQEMSQAHASHPRASGSPTPPPQE